jgi:hypothetical protein
MPTGGADKGHSLPFLFGAPGFADDGDFIVHYSISELR